MKAYVHTNYEFIYIFKIQMVVYIAHHTIPYFIENLIIYVGDCFIFVYT